MTAAELLAECQARDIDLQAHNGQLDIDAPAGALTDEILQRLRDAKAKLLMILGTAAAPATTDPNSRRAFPVAVEWPAAAADFCLLLTVDDLPPVPFKLNGWSTITDVAKFLRRLQADTLRGPSGPRAFYGALQADLLELRRFVLQFSKNEAAKTGDGPTEK